MPDGRAISANSGHCWSDAEYRFLSLSGLPIPNEQQPYCKFCEAKELNLPCVLGFGGRKALQLSFSSTQSSLMACQLLPQLSKRMQSIEQRISGFPRPPCNVEHVQALRHTGLRSLGGGSEPDLSDFLKG